MTAAVDGAAVLLLRRRRLRRRRPLLLPLLVRPALQLCTAALGEAGGRGGCGAARARRARSRRNLASRLARAGRAKAAVANQLPQSLACREHVDPARALMVYQVVEVWENRHDVRDGHEAPQQVRNVVLRVVSRVDRLVVPLH